MADVVAPADINQCLASLPSRQSLLTLMRRELYLSTEPNSSACARLRPSSVRALISSRSNNPLRVGDCLAINLRRHERSERGLLADEPDEDIHQLRHLRRSIEIHHHENLAACRIAIDGLRMEPSGAKAGFTFQVHPHMLRHACGFKLANDGADTRSLQHYLGHKNRVWSVVATHPSGRPALIRHKFLRRCC